jgi:hypothetical protein
VFGLVGSLSHETRWLLIVPTVKTKKRLVPRREPRYLGVPPGIDRPIGMERAENAPMKSTGSTIHYEASPEQKISKKTAAILIASVLAVAGVLIAIVR